MLEGENERKRLSTFLWLKFTSSWNIQNEMKVKQRMVCVCVCVCEQELDWKCTQLYVGWNLNSLCILPMILDT